MTVFKIPGGAQNMGPTHLNLRCPGCRREVTLDAIGTDIGLGAGGALTAFGQRRCPNEGCLAHVFVVYRAGEGVLAAYPAETLDFDASDLPADVASALREAVTCHAHECYAASAMMVRKTLEEVCRERGAEGDNLRARIEALRDMVVLPQGMIEALHNLRLLGNDAAHVESREFDQVGKEEVEVAIDVAKEILKATYQLQSIMGRLAGLKRDGA